jgi:RNA polymerase sigma factor (sigma-70 family)
MEVAVVSAIGQNRTAESSTCPELSDADLLKRFSAERDEAAFAALVNRHGPMVQGVCRRIIEDAHSAEDVFQAVFLVLVRKCATIRQPELLANWLYGVACRIARKARLKAIRTEARIKGAVKMQPMEQKLDLEWADLKQVLDEEIGQLPDKYRVPLILCYFQGRTNAEAAVQLGWPAGSMSECLSRAREILRHRLTRRGLKLSVALLAVLLSQKAASASVSADLIATTVENAVTYAAQGPAAGSLSANVLELVLDVTKPAIMGYLKTISVIVVLATTIVLVSTTTGFSKFSQWFNTGYYTSGNGSSSCVPSSCVHATDPSVAPADASPVAENVNVAIEVSSPVPENPVTERPATE